MIIVALSDSEESKEPESESAAVRDVYAHADVLLNGARPPATGVCSVVHGTYGDIATASSTLPLPLIETETYDHVFARANTRAAHCVVPATQSFSSVTGGGVNSSSANSTTPLSAYWALYVATSVAAPTAWSARVPTPATVLALADTTLSQPRAERLPASVVRSMLVAAAAVLAHSGVCDDAAIVATVERNTLARHARESLMRLQARATWSGLSVAALSGAIGHRHPATSSPAGDDMITFSRTLLDPRTMSSFFNSTIEAAVLRGGPPPESEMEPISGRGSKGMITYTAAARPVVAVAPGVTGAVDFSRGRLGPLHLAAQHEATAAALEGTYTRRARTVAWAAFKSIAMRCFQAMSKTNAKSSDTVAGVRHSDDTLSASEIADCCAFVLRTLTTQITRATAQAVAHARCPLRVSLAAAAQEHLLQCLATLTALLAAAGPAARAPAFLARAGAADTAAAVAGVLLADPAAASAALSPQTLRVAARLARSCLLTVTPAAVARALTRVPSVLAALLPEIPTGAAQRARTEIGRAHV